MTVLETERFLYAQSSSVADVKAGQSNSVSLIMSKKYYDIGDTGPGGGIIFYACSEGKGFTMTDTNETCHYLEFAPSDAVVNSTTVAFAWASTNNTPLISTGDSIGTGRNNTYRILNMDPNAPAAKACDEYENDGKTDWFLPSIDELEEINNAFFKYSNTLNYGFNTTDNYWSSSEKDGPSTEVAYRRFVPNTNVSYQAKTATARVRPIRAF